MIGPRSADVVTSLGEHAAHFVDAFEIAVAEVVQPVTDFRFELEVMQAPYLVAHGWSEYLPTPTFSPRC